MVNINLKKSLNQGIAILAVVMMAQSAAYSQQIIPDGTTATHLNTSNKTTVVSTETIKGNNAFNSFKQFNVYKGNTVNLVVPSNAENLINLVHNKMTYI